jgi:hypothetical protein
LFHGLIVRGLQFPLIVYALRIFCFSPLIGNSPKAAPCASQLRLGQNIRAAGFCQKLPRQPLHQLQLFGGKVALLERIDCEIVKLPLHIPLQVVASESFLGEQPMLPAIGLHPKAAAAAGMMRLTAS